MIDIYPIPLESDSVNAVADELSNKIIGLILLLFVNFNVLPLIEILPLDKLPLIVFTPLNPIPEYTPPVIVPVSIPFDMLID